MYSNSPLQDDIFLIQMPFVLSEHRCSLQIITNYFKKNILGISHLISLTIWVASSCKSSTASTRLTKSLVGLDAYFSNCFSLEVKYCLHGGINHASEKCTFPPSYIQETEFLFPLTSKRWNILRNHLEWVQMNDPHKLLATCLEFQNRQWKSDHFRWPRKTTNNTSSRANGRCSNSV